MYPELYGLCASGGCMYLNCMGNMASIIHPHIIVEKFNTYGMYTVVYTMDYASVWAQD